jgi:hypothetical protein
MNKPYNIQNTNICNGIFHISFFKVLSFALVQKKNNLFTVLVWFFVNFARKVLLEIFDKSRPKCQNTNICNSIFHISFFKALLINEGEMTRGERE